MGGLFVRWRRYVDPVEIRAASSPASWAALALAALTMIGVAGHAPVARDFFRLESGPALAFAVPPFVLGPTLGALRRRRRISATAFDALTVLNASLLKLFSGALVAFSSGAGAGLMAAPLIFLAAYHGHLYRATLKNPLELVVTAAVLLVAVWLAPDPLHLSIFAVAAPAALGGSSVLGIVAMRQRDERERTGALRAAVDAQILAERTGRAEDLAETLVAMMQNNHDASSALQAALASVEGITGEDADARRGERLRGVLQRLRALLEEARRIGMAQGGPVVEAERVGLLAPIDEALAALSVRFPTVEFSCELEADKKLDEVCVDVCGGETGLHRVLENLLVNAAQGNGVEGATNVLVSIQLEENVEVVRLGVIDDGPGFEEKDLARPVTGFQSSKPGGMGLGLYTVERLVRASGGSLARANRPNGGAEVSVFLSGGAIS